MPLKRTRGFLRVALKGILTVIVALLAIVLAAGTFFNWQRSTRETANRADVAPGNGRFIRISDGEVYIQETGTANNTPVLFVHGTGAWSELWRETLDRCPSLGHYCIALDLPPFGFSEVSTSARFTRVDQAKRILDVMHGINAAARFTLVGHSFGAGPTVEAVMRDASQVRSLVVVDGALGIDAASASPGAVNALLANPFMRDSILSSTVTNPMLTKQLLQPLLYNKDAATDARVTMLQRPLVVKDATAHLGTWVLDFANSASEDNLSSKSASYRALTVPTCIIWGDRDTVTPLEQADRLHDLIGHASLVTLVNVGHMPQIEDVEAFNGALFSFLNSENGSRASRVP